MLITMHILKSELNLRRLQSIHASTWILLTLAWLLCDSLVGCSAKPPHLRIDSINHPSTASRSPHPTLEDYWNGRARFVLDIADTGLPMGESETILLPTGKLRSYMHASTASLGVVDQCGQPVAFPGCVVSFSSTDGGWSFQPDRQPSGQVVCQINCIQCPCRSKPDQIDQQQYPRIAEITNDSASMTAKTWIMVYEYRANIMLRRSSDGLHWSIPEELPLTGIWQNWLMDCRPEERIGPHPHSPAFYNCLIGSPPGIYIDQSQDPAELYIFVGLGQNPGAMGCYRGPLTTSAALLRKCTHNPLFTGAAQYGPPELIGPPANPYFDFRTISSAEVTKTGTRYYMLYEGVRGATTGAAGDTQFGLGLARSQTEKIDGPWERFPNNPLLSDLPGNVGIGHAGLGNPRRHDDPLYIA